MPGSSTNELWLQWGALIGASLVAALTDLRQGRIPNWLTLPLWLLGLVWAMHLEGAQGFAGALGVSLLLALPYVALWVLAKGGAGDAKLMAAIGAWLSLDEGLVVLCCVATAGMILAILMIAARRASQNPLWGLLTSLYLLAAAWGSGTRGSGFHLPDYQGPPREQAGRLALPYGVAIFIGVCAGAVGARLWIG